MAPIAITFALPSESSRLVGRELEGKRVEKIAGGEIIIGTLARREVAIFHTGVGRKACARNLEPFLAALQPKLLLSSGFAGAVNERLAVGDVFVAENFSDPHLALNWESKARLFTAAAIIDSLEERNQIARANGADAVDMETETIAQLAHARGVPLLSLRVISDTPGQPFPILPHILFDMERQKTNLRRLLWYLLWHPRASRRLLAFSKQIDFARRQLTDAIVALIPKLPT